MKGRWTRVANVAAFAATGNPVIPPGSPSPLTIGELHIPEIVPITSHMSSPAPLYQIVYCSSTKGLLTVDQLCDLLVKSSAANQRQGISGVLLYKDGNVMQVLEGEQAVIAALFAKIKRDPRHTGVITLLEGKLEKRNFPAWSMAFRNLKAVDLKLMPEYGEFASVPLNEITSPAKSVKLLSMFKNAT